MSGWGEGVLLVAVPVVVSEGWGIDLGLDVFDAFGVPSRVVADGDGEACLGGCRGDEVDEPARTRITHLLPLQFQFQGRGGRPCQRL